VLELELSVFDLRKDGRWALSKEARVLLTVDALAAVVDIIRSLLEIARIEGVGARGKFLSENQGLQITKRAGPV
jgi:hypothetical protein